MRKKDLDPKDIELFRQQMEDVTPLTHNMAELPQTSVRRAVRMPSSDITNTAIPTRLVETRFEPESVTISNESIIQFRRSGIQDRIFRKLQRGQFPIEAELDLHGMTAYRAKIALDQFMEQVKYNNKQSCIRIIHGKGHGSKDGLPVIKRQTQLWLQCNINVLAYCSCRISDGGTGAIYVLVKHST